MCLNSSLCLTGTAVHGKEPLPIIDASEVQEVRKELVAIREKVNTLLNAIDGAPKPPASTYSNEVAKSESRTRQSAETISSKPEGIYKSAT